MTSKNTLLKCCYVKFGPPAIPKPSLPPTPTAHSFLFTAYSTALTPYARVPYLHVTYYNSFHRPVLLPRSVPVLQYHLPLLV